MKTKYYLGAGAAALVLAGVAIEAPQFAKEEGVAFVNPITLARAICGDNPAASASRRAFFMRIARANAQEPAAAPDAPERFGAIGYPVTTQNALAQAHFDQGVAHMWNFNHGAAIASFKAAQAADPACAMCWWGEALAYGPNINAPMAEEDAAPAWAALQQALERRDGASEKERALIDALAKRYAERPPADRSPLDLAFAEAMDEVARTYSDDDFILALAAEANMDTQPWDYWAADGRTAKGRTDRTISLIEQVLARNPDHPAAIHLYIHITEATFNPHRATAYAEKLAALSPRLGHLIHMPSHTWYRIGRFKDSLESNIEAVAADEAFLAANEAHPMYEYSYYVHNVHFVMTSAQMLGDGATALDMAEKLDAKLPTAMAEAVPFAQPIKASPYFAMAQFAEPQAILDLAEPELPFLVGAWRYARGEAYARLGDVDGARAEAEAIGAILADVDFAPLEALGVPATDVLNIARLTVHARAAAVEEDFATAVEAMEEAVALQEGLAYTEPPYWYYPAKQTLAAMALRAGDAERAEHLFLEALAEAPNNGWVLYGLSEAYKARKDKAAAKYAESLFKNAWAGDRKTVALARL